MAVKRQIKTGFASHLHHDQLIELRLRLFKLIPPEKLPQSLKKTYAEK